MNSINSLKLLKSLISYKPTIYFLNVLLWSLFIFSPLGTGLVTKYIFDSFSKTNIEFSYVWNLIIIFFCLILARAVIYFLASISHIYLEFYSTGLLRRNLFVQSLRSASRGNITNSIGEIINHFRDDVNICARLVGNSMLIPGCVLFSIVSFIILYNFDKYIAIWVFTPIIIITIILNILKVRLQEYRLQNRQATSEVSGFIGEVFNSIQTIKLGLAEERAVNRLTELSNTRRKKVIRDILLSKVIESLFSNINLIGTGILLIVAAEELKNGRFSIGEFAIFTYLLPFITEVIDTIGLFLARAKLTNVSLHRISELFDVFSRKNILNHKPLFLKKNTDFIPPKDSVLSPLESLSLKNVSFHYPKSSNGISNINLKIDQGQVIVIAGRTGAGKTTLLKVLIGALQKDKGTVLWNNKIIENPTDSLIPPRIAYSPQKPILLNGTLRENILLGLKDEYMYQALKISALEKDISKMPHYADTVIGSKGVKLSGGQVQRTSLARMFARDADIYVMDDVSSSLDIQTEKQLWNNIFKLDKTIITASQNREALRRADKIIVLKEGKIEAEGKLEDLLLRSEEMKYIWGQVKEESKK
ncbi:ABC transporter ATP-binding protein [Bacillus sp. 166amftsu]|uniref:ABC transporter ATP-binding protein n=1 Tax=Bacillus sp. 166amftsu TaxID=1761753 RepID=UPI00089777E3|nr:ABC transporter ATP-binding protein [Bacillus sp. 166amftsu]SDZ40441.1 ATP-binding cassette, subfamily B [Bacillus sp. 166amftsu]